MTLGSDAPLKGKSVLVTGATGGLGQAIVSRCLAGGATVFAGGRNEAKLTQLAKSWGEKVVPLIYDVTDERAVKETFRQIQKQQMQTGIGPLWGMVNNAGLMFEAPLSISSLDKFKEQLNVNLLAPYQHMQLAARLMSRQRKGSIVNIVSQVGEHGSSGMSAYAATKAALTGVTKSLAKELAPIGIRVNAVAPGFIDTHLTEHYEEHAREAVVSRIAFQRAGMASEVANAVFYLLSDQASYTSGHVLPVDGIFSP
ncbi:SDR family oxidoreductase [Alteromonas pelagimontana]|uniref:SDR family oxidoreductase n=1 Tax=Alteromonas pelagimontana TaxID=1858656 RepID=A0A6M4MFH2_9ALTE|nr:SDR family NAD(P)-dependent oxidoreductase [Alteromonas pelagimontana]QJR81832.1 SDR family oxidoreductase [Alteromonas pelagimontana]